VILGTVGLRLIDLRLGRLPVPIAALVALISTRAAPVVLRLERVLRRVSMAVPAEVGVVGALRHGPVVGADAPFGAARGPEEEAVRRQGADELAVEVAVDHHRTVGATDDRHLAAGVRLFRERDARIGVLGEGCTHGRFDVG